ncbi:MAG: hypothetical protein ACWA47_13610 [Brevirhabdus sp.]
MKLLNLTVCALCLPALAHGANYTCAEEQTCVSEGGENTVNCTRKGTRFSLSHGDSMAPLTLRVEGRAPETFVGLGPSGGAVARGMGQPGLGTPLKSVVLFDDLNFVVTSTAGSGDARMVEMMTGQCSRVSE